MSDKEKDIRVKSTGTIWGCAIAMLAICIPLSAATRSGAIIPLGVITGAAVGTAAVWRDKKSQTSLPASQLQQLEQRLANLETIVGSDDLEMRLKIKQLESRNNRDQLPAISDQ
jgi:hypothetical protein